MAGDIDIKSLKKAKTNVNLEKVDFVLLDAHNLPFCEKCFNVTTLIDVLEHLKHPEEALVEAKRCTKEKILINVPNYNFLVMLYPNMLPEHFKEPCHLHHTNVKLLCKWLKDAGLKNIKLYGSYIPMPYFLIPISYIIEFFCKLFNVRPRRIHFQISCEVILKMQ